MPDNLEVSIHTSAIVERGAQLGVGVRIGPFCHVGPQVQLGDGVELVGHVSVSGHTQLGAKCRVFPFASIGHQPQDLKYRGEPSELDIGAENIIREHVTMNGGTEGGGMVTRVGTGGLFMMGAHVAHDCQVGNRVIMANNATLAGHVVVGDHAFFGGLCAVHQFVRVGRNAMIGGMSGVENDIIPFGLVMGNRARLEGLNLIGLKRHGFPREEILGLQKAYKALFHGSGSFKERMPAVEAEFRANPLVMEVIAFLKSGSERAICQPPSSDAR